MVDPVAGRRIVLGVSGSIAAYKALSIASRLHAADGLVDVVLTDAATHLVQPLAFQALTHRPVITSLWTPTGAMGIDHVSLARSADAILVAPATANVLARMALGLADDALTTTILAATAPIVVAPAMEPHMWSAVTTQQHARTLRERGAFLVGPVEGRTASGEIGEGRMAEPDVVVEHLRVVLARTGDLAGRRIVVTAGPTREPLDPVRYLSNQSSGRMGLSVALAARNRGAQVLLIHGPLATPPPVGVTLIAVETAEEMRRAVLEHAPASHVLVMTAAVADYRPATASARKIKKSGAALTLDLAPNPDILVDLAKALEAAPPSGRPVRVGFAAETDDLLSSASAKRVAKQLDMIVANPVPATFGAATTECTLVDDRGVTTLGRLAKDDAADAILDRAVAMAVERAPR